MPGVADTSTQNSGARHARIWRCRRLPGRFDDPRAVHQLHAERSPELSHTQGLVDRSTAIMEKNDVAVNLLRAVDHDIATGVWPDMRQYGWAADDWPEIYPQVLDPGSGGPHNDFTS